MIARFDETWLLERKRERRAWRIPAGHPGAAVRLTIDAVAGTQTGALEVKWRDGAGEHDFTSALTLDTTTNTQQIIAADTLRGAGEIVLINPAVQSGVIVRVCVSIESPRTPVEGNEEPERIEKG